MKKLLTNFAAFLAISSVALATSSAQELVGDSEAEALCAYSEPAEGDDEATQKRNIERRKLLHQRFSVTVTAESAPVIGYDEVTGILTINAYRPLSITPAHAVVIDGMGALPFEVTSQRANEVIAHYMTGQARLKLEFVPASFADAEQPICTRAAENSRPKSEGEGGDEGGDEGEDAASVSKKSADSDATEPTRGHDIHVALLRAAIVDPLGRTLVGFDTALGREVHMLESNKIAGFLASAYPQVSVASVSFYDGKPSYPRTSPSVPEALASDITARIQQRLYGCYVRGLASNGRLQGALVVRFDASTSPKAAVMVDSLNSPPVSGCVLERLGEIGRTLAERTDEHRSLKATLIFRLEDNSL